MPGYSVEIVDSVRAVAADEWNRLAGSAANVNHVLMDCYETGNPQVPLRYLLLRDRRGELCAASFAALSGRWDPGISAVLFGRAASASSLVSRAFNPSLVCGLVRGPQSPILLQEGRDAAVWMPRLVEQIERHAAASGMATTFRTTQDQQLLSRLLRQRGYAEGLGLPVARAEITWDSLPSYLALLKGKDRKRSAVVRAEKNRFARSGIAIRQWDGADEELVYRLLRDHYEDRNPTQFDMPPDFLTRLRAAMGDDCIVYVAVRDHSLVGAVVLLRHKERGWLWKIGVDHRLDDGNFTYFNLGYYHVFQEAPRLGIRTIYYGNAALDVKRRRGCTIEFTRVFHRPRTHASMVLYEGLLSLQRSWYARKFASLVDTAASKRAG